MLDRYLQDALEKLKRGEFGKTSSGDASSNGKGGKGGVGSTPLVDSPVDTLRLELEEQKELATNRLSELELLQSNYEKGLREVSFDVVADMFSSWRGVFNWYLQVGKFICAWSCD